MSLSKVMFSASRILVLILTFSSCISFAQEGDSLQQNLKFKADTATMRISIKTAGKLRDKQPDSSFQILELIFPYVSASSDEKIKAEYLNERGAVLTNLGRYDEAILYLELAKTKYVALNMETGIASVNNNWGHALFKKGDYEEALKLFVEAEETYLRIGNIEDAIATQQAQAAVFLELGNYSTSLKLFRKAEESAMEIDDEVGLLTIRLNMGSVYYYTGSLDTAAFYYQMAGAEAEKQGRYTIQIAAYSNLASVYFQMHRFDESIELDEKALKIVREKGDRGMEISLLNNLAGSYATINDYTKANQVLDEALILCDVINSPRNKLVVIKTKADILYHSGKGKEAYEWLLQHVHLKDSMTTAESQIKMAELEAEHNEFKNEQQIKELEKDQIISGKELELSKASEQKFIYLVVAIGAVLIIIAIALIVNFRKNKELQSKNVLIEENLKEKEMLLMEVHHRVKNNLQMIYSILNMQTKDASEESAALLHENKDRIRSISIIHEKLYMNEDITNANLNELFSEIAGNASKTSKHHASTEIAVSCDSIKLDMDTLISLGILVNELVTNSLKYAFQNSESGNKIQINLRQINDTQINLVVADNGPGFPATFDLNHTTSFGFRMIQTLCKKLKGTISVENKNGAAVTIAISRFKTTS
jgi:two-component sensor histidine kinase/Tfp pilus assembly protein PilF